MQKTNKSVSKGLEEAVQRHEALNPGILFEEVLKKSKEEGGEKQKYRDKFGLMWRIREGILYYAEEPKIKHLGIAWELANMDGYDLPFKKFLTEEEYQRYITRGKEREVLQC